MNKKEKKNNNYQLPLKAECFRCQGGIIINYVFPLQGYPKKNNWGYWTEKKENENKYICNNCLKNLYLNNKSDFHFFIQNTQKKQTLRSYISEQRI